MIVPDFVTAVRDDLGQLVRVARDSRGQAREHPADQVGFSWARIYLNDAEDPTTISLKLPAPVQSPSLYGTQSIIAAAGDVNGDGIGDVAIAVSMVESVVSNLKPADLGVYILFGRESWNETIDVVREADVTITGFVGTLSLASVGNFNGDAFDDLLVGDVDPTSGAGNAYLFHGRRNAEWPKIFLRANFGDLLFTIQPQDVLLADGSLAPALLDEFADAGVTLVAPSGVVEEADRRWIITDQDQKYLVLANDQLNVYHWRDDESTDAADNDFTVANDNSGRPGFNYADDLWHVSERRGEHPGHSTGTSFYFGTEQRGTYEVEPFASAGRLISPVVDLRNFDQAELLFRYFLQTEPGDAVLDRATVMVRHITETSVGPFEPLPFEDDPSNRNVDNIQGVLVDATTGWNSLTIDLTKVNLSGKPLLGTEVQFAFDFDTTNNIANNFEGWFIDDVVVREPLKADQDAQVTFSITDPSFKSLGESVAGVGPVRPCKTINYRN